jgi:hypothetical protein
MALLIPGSWKYCVANDCYNEFYSQISKQEPSEWINDLRRGRKAKHIRRKAKQQLQATEGKTADRDYTMILFVTGFSNQSEAVQFCQSVKSDYLARKEALRQILLPRMILGNGSSHLANVTISIWDQLQSYQTQKLTPSSVNNVLQTLCCDPWNAQRLVLWWWNASQDRPPRLTDIFEAAKSAVDEREYSMFSSNNYAVNDDDYAVTDDYNMNDMNYMNNTNNTNNIYMNNANRGNSTNNNTTGNVNDYQTFDIDYFSTMILPPNTRNTQTGAANYTIEFGDDFTM